MTAHPTVSALEPIERALQDEGRRMLIDHLCAPSRG